jgi:hypothetical protein
MLAFAMATIATLVVILIVKSVYNHEEKQALVHQNQRLLDEVVRKNESLKQVSICALSAISAANAYSYGETVEEAEIYLSEMLKTKTYKLRHRLEKSMKNIPGELKKLNDAKISGDTQYYDERRISQEKAFIDSVKGLKIVADIALDDCSDS